MNDVPLLTHIEALLESYELRRADARDSDRRWLESYIDSAGKALELQANAYPTVKDFNELRLSVKEEFARLQGRTSMRETIWRGLTVVAIVGTVIVAIFTYYAPAR